jgi:hypothetical protein
MKNLGTYRGAPFVTSSYSNPSDCVAVARAAVLADVPQGV